ncbi:acyltransferase family protein [Schwartzia sp. (in: firmicutes)]
MKQRDRTLDIAKGISMLLVVGYHIILSSPETEPFFECVCGVLGFFTFAAGYTYRRGKRTFGASVMSRVTGMMLPYFKISFAALTLSCSYYHFTRSVDWQYCADQYVFTYFREELTEMIWPGYFRGEDCLYNLVSPGWYLWMLFFASILFYGTADFALQSSVRTIALTVLFGAVSYVMIDSRVVLPYGMQCAPVYAAVMLIGSYCGNNRLLDFDRMGGGRKLFLAALSFAIIFIVLRFELVEKTFLGQFRDVHSYVDGVIAYILLGLSDTFLLMWLSRAIAKCGGVVADWLVFFGAGTIVTLLIHGPFSLLWFDLFSMPCKFAMWVRDYTTGELLASVAVFLLTMVSCHAVLRLREHFKHS